MYEKVIHNTEELNAMAVHLRMAQNFSELRMLAAERLVPEQDVEDFISGKRFLLAEVPVSEKNYASAAEKLREEMWHLKDQLFTDLVAQYLIERAKEDILFGFRVMKKQKSLQKCMDYIMKQAYQMAKKEREKKFGNQNQSFGLGIAETKVYQWAEEYYALEDEAKEDKEQAAERKKRLNALKRKEERRKNADSPKKAAKDTAQKTKEPAEQAAGRKQTEKQKQETEKGLAAEQKQTTEKKLEAEQKQSAEQKEIPETSVMEEEPTGEPEADLEGRQITVFDLLSGSDAASKGGKE